MIYLFIKQYIRYNRFLQDSIVSLSLNWRGIDYQKNCRMG